MNYDIELYSSDELSAIFNAIELEKKQALTEKQRLYILSKIEVIYNLRALAKQEHYTLVILAKDKQIQSLNARFVADEGIKTSDIKDALKAMIIEALKAETCYQIDFLQDNLDAYLDKVEEFMN